MGTRTRARHATGSTGSVPAVGPSDVSERSGTAVVARSYVTRSKATGFRAQYRATSSDTQTAVCTWKPECGQVRMPAA